MKSQTGIELAVIAIMMLVGVMALYLPTLLYHFSSQISIEYEYQYDNAQLLLLSMMPITVTDSLTNSPKSLMELLGEYIQLQAQQKVDPSIKTPDTMPIQNELSSFVGKNGLGINCYKLSADTDIIKPPNCNPSKYQESTTIPLPYNPNNLVKTITLVIEQ